MSTRRPTARDLAEARSILGVRPGASRVSVLAAWRAAVRANHPDAAPEGERAAAETRCSRINAAKDLLLAHPDSAPARPDPGADARWHGAAPGTPGPGRGSSPPNGTRTAPLRPDPSRSTAPATGLLIALLVLCTIGGLAVLALTTRGDGAPRDGVSRIGDDPSPPLQQTRAPDASRPPGVSLPADSPEDAMAMLLFSVQHGSSEVFDALVHPDARTAELADVVARLQASDRLGLTRAAETTECRLGQRDLPDISYCHVAVPQDLLPDRVELRRTTSGWRLVGYARTG